MRLKSILAALLLMVAGLQTAKAQKVLIYKANKTAIELEVLDVDSIVFVEVEAETKLVTAIVLNDDSISLQVNETKSLTATVLPEDAENKTVTWESSNDAVATVSNEGLVTAVAEGTCTITCSATDGSGVKAECIVTVPSSSVNVVIGLPTSTAITPYIQWEADMMVFNNGETYNSSHHNQVIDTPPTDARGNEWYDVNYQLTNGTTSWSRGKAPFSSDATYNGMTSTQWTTFDIMADIYLRREFVINQEVSDKILFSCGHDDAPAEWYLNGVLIRSVEDGWDNEESTYLTSEQCALIRTDGTKNILAIHVHNNFGGAFADGGLYDKGKAYVDYGLPVSTIKSPDVPWSADVMSFMGDRYPNISSYTSVSNVVIGTPPADSQGREWYVPNYELTDGENSWSVGQSPFAAEIYSYDDRYEYPNTMGTIWTRENYIADVYLRRYFIVQGELSDKILFSCSHDDAPAEWYLNGVLIRSVEDGCDESTGWVYGEEIYLTPEQRALIYTDGRINVFAIHVHNNWGRGLADGGLYEENNSNLNHEGVQSR
jgi:hypothetical protein